MPLSDPAPLLLDAALRGVLMALLLVLALVLETEEHTSELQSH